MTIPDLLNPEMEERRAPRWGGTEVGEVTAAGGAGGGGAPPEGGGGGEIGGGGGGGAAAGGGGGGGVAAVGGLVAAEVVGAAGGVGLDTGRSRQRIKVHLALGKSYCIASFLICNWIWFSK